MIKFIKNTVVGVWLDGEIIAVISENNTNHNEAICDAVKDHLSAEDVIITGLWEFAPGKGELKAEVSVHIYEETYEDGDDRYETIELTCITQY